METAVALGLTGLLAYYSWSRQKLTPMGIIAAVLTGLVHAIHPWKAFYAFLIVFFIGGTAVTKVKHDVKTRLTLSSAGSAGGEGPRTHVQVLANSIIATALILLHLTQLGYFSQGTASLSDCWRKRDGLVVAGITINYAAVAADTFSSELGILSRSAPRLITSPAFRRVPAGTNGGVTLLGTLAGFLGSFTIAITSLVFLPFCKTTASEAQGSWTLRDKILWAVFVIVWGAAGSLLDSLLGGLFQASVVDVRTGKVVEGVGGKKVLVQSSGSLSLRPAKGTNVKASILSGDGRDSVVTASGTSNTSGNAKSRSNHSVITSSDPEQSSEMRQSSRRVEAGMSILDNNAVNLLMAMTMSFSAVFMVSWWWNLPLSTLSVRP